MISQILHRLDYTTELLQYFNGSTVIDVSAHTFTAANIGSGLTAGDLVYITGTASSTSDGLYTLQTVAAGVLTTVELPAGNDETATITINQQYSGDWQNVERWAKLTGTINTSGNAYVYIDQSGGGADGITKTNTDYTTTVTVTGGTAASWSIEVVAKWARMRIRNNGADQTTMRAYSFARHLT